MEIFCTTSQMYDQQKLFVKKMNMFNTKLLLLELLVQFKVPLKKNL